MNLVLLQAAPGGSSGMYMVLGIMVVFMVFFVYLPQRKKDKEKKKMLEELKTGTKVVTAGGFLGKIVTIDGEEVVLELGKGTNVRILKSSITEVKA